MAGWVGKTVEAGEDWSQEEKRQGNLSVNEVREAGQEEGNAGGGRREVLVQKLISEFETSEVELFQLVTSPL